MQVESWSTEMERHLIEEVEKKKNLWDIRDPLYTKKTLKRVCYEEIGQSMAAKWPQHVAIFNPGKYIHITMYLYFVQCFLNVSIWIIINTY